LSLPLLTCVRCGAYELGIAEITAFRNAYRAELRRRAAATRAAIVGTLSQKKLESLLGLSHGYISKLAHAKQVPSGALTTLLALIAASPFLRIHEIRNADYHAKECAAALLTLRSFIGVRKLELLLDLSSGYLSKIAHTVDKKEPNRPLVILLVMLAAEPERLREMDLYWMTPKKRNVEE
jgi:hypothetical protein